jgi:beta-glucosidase
MTASVTVTNTGSRAGTEVAQLYIRAMAFAGGTPPVRELKGFQKVFLQPGETRDVSFEIPSSELGFYDTRGNWVVQPGLFEVWISKDSASGDPVDFELD